MVIVFPSGLSALKVYHILLRHNLATTTRDLRAPAEFTTPHVRLYVPDDAPILAVTALVNVPGVTVCGPLQQRTVG